MKLFRHFRNAPHQIRGLKAFISCLPKGSIGVEVGCGYGESMALFMASGRVKELVCVDPWIGEMEAREPFFEERAKKWPGRVHKAKSTSQYVGRHYAMVEAKRFDFVYIDAKHDFASVAEDIETWRKTLKSGGILAGHDYRHGVQKAVDHFLGGPQKTFEDSTWMVRL